MLVLIGLNGRLGSLNTASALVRWGVFIPSFETAAFAISAAREIAGLSGVGLNTGGQSYMAGIKTLVVVLMLIVIAVTQLRQGKSAGWIAVPLALLLDGEFEWSGAAPLSMVPSWCGPSGWRSTFIHRHGAVRW